MNEARWSARLSASNLEVMRDYRLLDVPYLPGWFVFESARSSRWSWIVACDVNLTPRDLQTQVLEDVLYIVPDQARGCFVATFVFRQPLGQKELPSFDVAAEGPVDVKIAKAIATMHRTLSGNSGYVELIKAIAWSSRLAATA